MIIKKDFNFIEYLLKTPPEDLFSPSSFFSLASFSVGLNITGFFFHNQSLWLLVEP